MTISVVMATFNGTKYLPEQLQSLLKQTTPPAEVVCLDDASTDDTVAMLQEFAERAPFPVRVHTNEFNLGAHQTFGQAIALALSDVICCCDQDDVWVPDKLETVEARFRAEPALGLLMNDARLVDERLRDLGMTLWQKWHFGSSQRRKVASGTGYQVFAQRMPPYGSTMSFRADIRETLLPIREPNTFDSWIGGIASVLVPCGFISRPLQLYRQHQDQVTGFAKTSLKSRITDLRRQGECQVLVADTRRQEAFVHVFDANATESRRKREALDWARGRIHTNRRRLRIRRSRGFSRLGVAGLVLDGSYHRYASGLRSAAVDLIAPQRSRLESLDDDKKRA